MSKEPKLIEPDCVNYFPLPRNLTESTVAEWNSFRDQCLRSWCDTGVRAIRITEISDKYPNPPYPDGMYIEGWLVDPAKMEPFARQAPFNYPLVAA